MSESADTQYEELHKQIADLRKDISFRETEVSKLNKELTELKQQLTTSQSRYDKLLAISFDNIIQNNKIIATLVEKIHGYE